MAEVQLNLPPSSPDGADKVPQTAASDDMNGMAKVESIQVSSVLEETVDQLAILGHVLPSNYSNMKQKQEVIDKQITNLVESQLDGQAFTNGDAGGGKKLNVAKMLRDNVQTFNRAAIQNPTETENLSKLQGDRGFIQSALMSTLIELRKAHTFQTLFDVVEEEKQRKSELLTVVAKDEGLRKRIKQLQRDIIEVERSRKQELQERSALIAHLKDQLQETRAKTNMEGKFIKKWTEVAVSQTQKKCTMSEKDLENEINKTKERVDEETRVNTEIENFLRTHEKRLEEKQEYWMKKYQTEVDAAQIKLEKLKADKASDLDKLERMTRTFEEYTKIVEQDKVEKEKERKKRERDESELRAGMRLQGWWRSILTRRGLGSYGKKKKGKKSGKGKKKK